MNAKERKNRNYLEEMGIDNLGLRDVAIKAIPCGVILVQDAMEDKTSLFANSPRALMMCEYKGLITGLIEAQKVLDKIVKQ